MRPLAHDAHITPSPELLKVVKAAFVLHGTSLHAFCAQNNLIRQNVTAALTGRWKGPKASKTIDAVLKAAQRGINP